MSYPRAFGGDGRRRFGSGCSYEYARPPCLACPRTYSYFVCTWQRSRRHMQAGPQRHKCWSFSGAAAESRTGCGAHEEEPEILPRTGNQSQTSRQGALVNKGKTCPEWRRPQQKNQDMKWMSNQTDAGVAAGLTVLGWSCVLTNTPQLTLPSVSVR